MDKLPQRKNNRLKNYDYSQAGYYFITLCSENKKKLFWKVGETCGLQFDTIPLSNIGQVIDEEIKIISSCYKGIEINKYVIMPNHIHLIIILNSEIGMSQTTPTISRIIQQFKGSISKKVGFPLWQKSFYDHIIRDEEDYKSIYNYIETNPMKWEEDKYF